jgi:ubiquinone/menaquinone biosynthesis C-methylase UbiE
VRPSITRFFSTGSNGKADFGFTDVDAAEKERMVREVFSKVAEKYDVMNDVMSFGTHRLWKDELISMMGIPAAAHASPDHVPRHLDVAGGTGDIAFRSLGKIHTSYGNTIRRRSMMMEAEAKESHNHAVFDADRQIVICDINPEMLEVGKQRADKLFTHEQRDLVSNIRCGYLLFYNILK